MSDLGTMLVDNLIHVPVFLFLLWVIYWRFGSKKPLPPILEVPGRALKLVIILVTLGLLAGCAGSDSLAVASGPLFPLNAGHWQPTPQELAAPPLVADR